ncbi:hypothetical protein [Paraburkholderia sp.]|uniref:hypothetical protein n=1 Tax=Paraburkholderia sp. TaxID=1926495 RepID=UPI0039E28909
MVKLPIELPEGWSAEQYDDDCITLYAWPTPGLGRCCVTVNYKERSFVLGCMRPRRTVLGVDLYRGRGWKAELFNAAIAALQKVM